ncbi:MULTISPECIES: hypothetical protein [Aeromonas]|uniref:hypothetical protein n=1 Tax=Aeromonas TaxID=642 RepID=UPI001C214615|nr:MULTISPECIES: hypothetical protein [Aeromonas]MCR3937939.1 hypothetical protein [Aeromonas caviae]MDX7598868.1 hypothetical protein [Aeromonas caviae]MDX7805109.1 hypothetical protein [Aeromonas caviae]MDX7856133.1 hypothetical protein [Aeromonas caviae]MDY7800747.1 hypothetical protein [Aeromonas caviae]
MDVLSSFVEEQKSKSDSVHLFGVIIYTNIHPNNKKVLHDDDYWQALHELTGDNLSVFSVRPAKGRYEFPRLPPGVFSMMVPIWN